MLWKFLIKCIQGEDSNKPLMYAHLLTNVDHLDLQHLYKTFQEFCCRENFKTFCDILKNFHTAKVQRGESIFNYADRLEGLVKEVSRLNFLAEGAGKNLNIPEFMVVSKLIEAAGEFKQFSFFLLGLLHGDAGEWLKYTPQTLIQKLRSIQASGENLGLSLSPETTTIAVANLVNRGGRGGPSRGGGTGRKGGNFRGRSQSPARNRGEGGEESKICFSWN